MSAVIPSAVRIVELAKIRSMLADIRDGHGRESLSSVEWRALPHGLKVVVILMAGMDDAHSHKAFGEFTPPERDAIKSQIRSMKRALAPLMALSGW